MNEQFRLPAQEWLGYDPERGDIHGYTPEQMREFAELIVRECEQALRPQLRDMISRGQAYELIKRHFGVEQ